MYAKKIGGRVYGAGMTAGEKRAMQMEIQRQLGEYTEKHEQEIVSTVLYVLHKDFEFGKVRLRRFYDSFDICLKDLVERYNLEEDEDKVWLATYELAKYGIDLDIWKEESEASKTMAKDYISKNAEGYNDPTVRHLLKKEEQEEARFHKLLHAIFNLCDLAGFTLEGRITLVDKKTGRVWK